MEIVKFADAPFYTAADHEQIIARRLQGGAASMADFVAVGHSTFPSGAVIPMGTGDFGKVYVVTEGCPHDRRGRWRAAHPGGRGQRRRRRGRGSRGPQRRCRRGRDDRRDAADPGLNEGLPLRNERQRCTQTS